MAVSQRALEATGLPRLSRLARVREWWEQEHVFGYSLIVPALAPARPAPARCAGPVPALRRPAPPAPQPPGRAPGAAGRPRRRSPPPPRPPPGPPLVPHTPATQPHPRRRHPVLVDLHL